MGGYALPSENNPAYSKGDGLIIKGPIRMFEKKMFRKRITNTKSHIAPTSRNFIRPTTNIQMLQTYKSTLLRGELLVGNYTTNAQAC